MGRTAAVIWHATFSVVAAALYFFFVLPRWPELNGDTSHTLGTVARIVAGALIGLAALPVVFTLLRTRRPEYGTPRMALTLRVWSIALHVVAGVLIVGTAIAEIWLSLDDAGRWLFGIYGAAAAIGILGIAAFYLAFVAELPPPPPRPIKPTKAKQRRRRRREGEEAEAATEEIADTEGDETTEAETETADEASDGEEQPTEEKPAEVTAEAPAAEESTTAELTAETPTTEEPTTEEPGAEEPTTEEPVAEDETTSTDDETPDAEDTVAVEAPRGGLRNQRPGGRSLIRRRKRSRGGVSVEE